MALPASGQISSGDIRSELILSSVSSFSFAEGAYGNYVSLNAESTSVPPSSGQVDISDWYSYCHTCAEACGATIYTVANNRYVVFDLGTSSGIVFWSGSSPCCLVTGTKIIGENMEEKEIENFKEGEKVFDGNGFNTIQKIGTFDVQKIYNFNRGLLESSESHNHFIKEEHSVKIKKSHEVKIGDKFLKPSGEEVNIESIEQFEGNFQVHNIELDGNKLYVANGVLTHNKCYTTVTGYFGYPYNSSGSLTATTAFAFSCNTQTGQFDYTYLTNPRYLYVDVNEVSGCGSAVFNIPCPTVEVYWSFSMGANSGDMQILVNGSQVVYETSTNAGYFYVVAGDDIDVYTSSQLGFGYTFADSTTTIYEDNTQVCTDTQSGNPSANSYCGHTAAGLRIEIYGSAAQV